MGKRRQPFQDRRTADWNRATDAIRRLVAEKRYQLSAHVVDKIEDNEFTFDDVIESILYGSVHGAESDEKGDAIDGKKYRIRGKSHSGIFIETIGKIVRGPDGHEYLVITGY